MRLWAWQMLPYLSELQFKGQLRELVLVMRQWRDDGKTNHLLINRVMEYPKRELYEYWSLYYKEYTNRYNKNIDKYDDEFWNFCGAGYYDRNPKPFKDWHTKEYLRVCYANLYEKHKFGVGKSRISDEEWRTLCEGYKEITGEEYAI